MAIEHRILRPGENCWRIEHAGRVAFLVDGEQYFSALRDTIKAARRQLLVLAWDIDSRFALIHTEPEDDLPVRLGDFLNAVVAGEPRLRAHVLGWDFAMIFAMSREWLPLYKLDWTTHRRLEFRMDDRHARGASHHQKVVVVDDAVAFCGGLDITQGRWDTNEHAPDDPRRRDAEGRALRPYHDVQAAVDGDAARALGDLARERWKRAGCGTLRRPEPVSGSPWAQGLEPDLTDVEVAIVRTVGPFRGRAAVREAEQLYLDSIASARTSIYIENQFFTAEPIAEALAKRLAEEDGPEVVLVLPLRTEGWLSQQSLDVIRVELIRRLREADRHERFSVYYPHVEGLTTETAINVHAKVMIVDDDFVRVGSSNLNNRSMSLDSECDVAVESGGNAGTEEGIARFRARLLAEHLGTDVRTVTDAIEAHGTLGAAIEDLRGAEHSLWPLEPRLAEEGDGALAGERLLMDPDRPLDPESFIDRVVPQEQKPSSGRSVLGFLALVLGLLGLAAAWRWTPLGEWLDVQTLVELGRETQARFAVAAATAVGAFLLAGLVVVPLTILVVATGLLFGPVAGFAIAFTGANLSALLTYGLGATLGRRAVRNLGGNKVNRVSKALARRGILAVMVIRMLPVAPFTVVNLVAGASHIRFRDFLVGTLLGMAPGMLAVIALTDRVTATLQSPDLATFATLALVALAIVAVATVLMRVLVSRSSKRADEPAAER